jgi:two-component system alkaline phosphatase synthesis response regulator PhoP
VLKSQVAAPETNVTSRNKVLLVEDDRNLQEAIRYNLVAEGYEVLVTGDGDKALSMARNQKPDLLVLDVMLPGMSGTDICHTLRLDGSTAAIIMLTARDSEADRIVGLELGADDYVVKPFSMRELLARVSAQLRRATMLNSVTTTEATDVIDVGGLRIDLAGRRVKLDNKEIELRPREFDLLAFLAARPGRVYSRDQLLQEVWGFDYAGDTRTVDVHVRWLRMKIEANPSAPLRVQTVRGVGYRFST